MYVSNPMFQTSKNTAKMGSAERSPPHTATRSQRIQEGLPGCVRTSADVYRGNGREPVARLTIEAKHAGSGLFGMGYRQRTLG